MSGETPKLFTNKPKKCSHHTTLTKRVTTPGTMASSFGAAAAAAAAPPPPPTPPSSTLKPQKESFIRRYRFLWPLLLVVNFSIGAYILVRTTRKDKEGSSELDELEAPTNSSSTSTAAAGASSILGETPTASTSTLASTGAASIIAETPTASITEKPMTQTIVDPVQRTPIPDDRQRELFKWILEDRRKVKAKDAEEKKRIDEEKALLKQFIRAKSIPNL